MDLEQILTAAAGGSPVALVVGAMCRLFWTKYQESLARVEELHKLIRDRDQAELEAWRKLGNLKLGESGEGQ